MLTILNPTDTFVLAALPDVKYACGVTGSADDTVLTRLVVRASRAIQEHCGWAFGPMAYKQTFRFPGAQTTRQRDYIRLAISPIQTDAQYIPAGATTALSGVYFKVLVDGVLADPATYEIDYTTGILKNMTAAGLPIPWTGTVIEVRYCAGYGIPTDANPAFGTLPSAVSQTCIDLVAGVFAAAGRDSAVKVDSVQDVGRMEYFDRGTAAMALDRDMAARLYRFRRLPE